LEIKKALEGRKEGRNGVGGVGGMVWALMICVVVFPSQGKGVEALAVNPGAVRSDIWRYMFKPVKRLLMDPLMHALFLDIDQGNQFILILSQESRGGRRRRGGGGAEEEEEPSNHGWNR